MDQIKGIVLKYHNFDLASLKKLVNELIVDCDRYVGRVNVSYFIKSDKLKVVVKYQNPIGELFKHGNWHHKSNDYTNKGEYVEKYFEFDINELTKYKVLFFIKDVLNKYNEKLTNIINNQWYLQYKLTHIDNNEWNYYYWNHTNIVKFTDYSMLDFLSKNNNNDTDDYRIEIRVVSHYNDYKYTIYNNRYSNNTSIKNEITLCEILQLKEMNAPPVIKLF